MEYLITKEQFEIAKQSWKSKKEHDACDHIIYNLLRSKPIDRGFSEKKSNIQGNNPWHTFDTALQTAKIRITYRPEEFKETFGISLPDNLLERMKR